MRPSHDERSEGGEGADAEVAEVQVAEAARLPDAGLALLVDVREDDARNVPGGMRAWQADGLPVTTDRTPSGTAP